MWIKTICLYVLVVSVHVNTIGEYLELYMSHYYIHVSDFSEDETIFIWVNTSISRSPLSKHEYISQSC